MYCWPYRAPKAFGEDVLVTRLKIELTDVIPPDENVNNMSVMRTNTIHNLEIPKILCSLSGITEIMMIVMAL